MKKSFDPTSVKRTDRISASYVLRRRYGRTRFVIVAASWITVLNIFLQPLAALAGSLTWDNNWRLEDGRLTPTPHQEGKEMPCACPDC
jgi:hypothetical protein